MNSAEKIKPICFYLPQFHQIPENDRWWGEGFTEWSLVKEAKPLYVGHQQPVKPEAGLGYYDASEYETRRQQAELAKQYGIYGFCYYHYWFGGERLLEKPLENMLKDGQPDLPFCLCWANEPWSRRWSGEDRQVLQSQVYGDQLDWENHFTVLFRFFEHENYISIDGRPVFLIYRIGHIPDAEKMIACWRTLAHERGLPGLHIVAVEGGFPDSKHAPAYVDAAAEHQPSCVIDEAQPLVMNGLHVYSAEEIWQRSLERTPSHAVCYPGACFAWDNTPRRERDGRVVLASRPERFRHYLDEVFKRVRDSDKAPFVFINAWNEWSEGAHLEPERQYGDAWLACVQEALKGPAASNIVHKTSLNDMAPATRWPGRLVQRPQIEQDADLINIIILHSIKARCVVDFGCASGVSSQYIRWFTGADRYIGLEPNADWVREAKTSLNEVYQIDADTPDISALGKDMADFIVCSDLLNRVIDPVAVLSALQELIAPDGLVCLSFEHAGSYENMQNIQNSLAGTDQPEVSASLSRKFSVAQARAMVEAAGFSVDKIYHVYSPELSRLEAIRENDNSLQFGNIRFDNLSRIQLEALFCSRFFLIVRPDADSIYKKQMTMTDSAISYERYKDRVKELISPKDALYAVYNQRGAALEYYQSAFQQLTELDILLQKYCHQGLLQLESVGDYACHYGRLLRALRAVLPNAELCAYDIDAGASAFCERNFGCEPCAVDWENDLDTIKPRHQLLISASLLTHTGLEFYRQVLAVWESLVLPGGLLCFTYLGDQYIPRWLNGELDHYGSIDLQTRKNKVKEYARQGHMLAGFDTPYSDDQAYGVGFMNEATMLAELAQYPSLEYLGTVPGQNSRFNQDLAVVRKKIPA